MSIDRVIDRVRKLLAASRSDNEPEAAVAASRAAELMSQYHLDEVMLRADDSSREAEPLVDGVRLDDDFSRRRVAWREVLAGAVATSLGVRMYLGAHNRLTCFGRQGATQAWQYTCQYLHNEVEPTRRGSSRIISGSKP